MRVSVMELEKVFVLIITASTAAAATIVSVPSDVYTGQSLETKELPSNTTDFLTGSENEQEFNRLESMLERNTLCENYVSDSSCQYWANLGECNIGIWINWMTTYCKKTCNRCRESVGSIFIGSQCLTFSSDELNWHEAVAACASHGSHLAIIENPNAALDYVIEQYGRGVVQLWIGGSDISNEGSWLWLDHRPLSNFPWGSGQPDNAGGNENCLEVNYDGGYNDEPCTVTSQYICESGGCAGIIIGHQCLIFNSDELNWHEAVAACASHGNRLAVIANPNEVLDYVIGRYGRGVVQLWIGGSDITNEGTWLWLDNRPMSNFPWGSNQPDNAGGNENCLEVNYDGGYNDEPCTVRSQYICESGYGK